MSLKTIVIVNEVNNLSDARYCAGMGVDYLGFVLEDGHPSSISHDLFKELAGWVEGPQFMAEFESYSEEQILSIMSDFELKVVQVTDQLLAKTLLEKGFEVFLKTAGPIPDGKFSINLVNQEMDQTPADPGRIIIEATEHGPKLDALLEKGFKGISIKGGSEIRPGYRDFDEMADILEALEED